MAATPRVSALMVMAVRRVFRHRLRQAIRIKESIGRSPPLLEPVQAVGVFGDVLVEGDLLVDEGRLPARLRRLHREPGGEVAPADLLDVREGELPGQLALLVV